jgi:hypothetical protein
MTTITQEQYEDMARAHNSVADEFEDAKCYVGHLLNMAGITVEEPPYVPSKPGEAFVDKDGDVWEVSTSDSTRAHIVSDANDLDYVAQYYGPLKPYV